MATYAVLGNWTDQGVRTASQTVDRAKAIEELAPNFGATIRDVFWILGPYDVLLLVEVPNEEAATAFALAVSSQGNLRTATMRAYGREEMSAILSQIG